MHFMRTIAFHGRTGLLLPSEVDLDVLRRPDSTSDADRSDSDLDSHRKHNPLLE
jgi:hypothetical protein